MTLYFAFQFKIKIPFFPIRPFSKKSFALKTGRKISSVGKYEIYFLKTTIRLEFFKPSWNRHSDQPLNQKPFTVRIFLFIFLRMSNIMDLITINLKIQIFQTHVILSITFGILFPFLFATSTKFYEQIYIYMNETNFPRKNVILIHANSIRFHFSYLFSFIRINVSKNKLLPHSLSLFSQFVSSFSLKSIFRILL